MPRLRRSSRDDPGYARRRRGRGFQYLDCDGEPLRDEDARARIDALAIPPAWEEVWICTDENGHLQATGIDAAGRLQYRYHDQWRERRDQAKFERLEEFGVDLPPFRRRVTQGLRRSELDRERILCCAGRLLDIGFFRIGSEEHAENTGAVGLVTVRKQHVSVTNGDLVFDYPAKSGIRRVQAIADPDVIATVKRLLARRGDPELLAWREGRKWRDVRSDDVNEWLHDALRGDFTAKDFRTWHGTVLAAVALAAGGGPPDTKTARRRAVKTAIEHVAAYLGNTPAVCRASYVDPRIVDAWHAGETIAAALPSGDVRLDRPRVRSRVEKAVLDLLAS